MKSLYLSARVRLLRDQLRDAERELAKAQTDECPIKVGTILRHKETGKQCIVRGADFLDSPEPFRLWVSPIRKDGEWSNREVSLFGDDYEVYEVTS